LKVSPREKKHLTFTMDNIFGSGTYTIGATIRSRDKVTIYESWEHASKFSNTREESYYPVMCPAVLTIKDGS